jgi:hypothetical protein
MEDQPITRPLPTQDSITKKNAKTYINSLSWTGNHNPSVHVVQEKHTMGLAGSYSEFYSLTIFKA